MLQKFYDEEKEYYGFKDDQGTIIIPAIYDKVEDFQHGFAVVQPNDRVEWGLIDKKGKVVVPFEYDFVIVYKVYNICWIYATRQKENFLFTTSGELVLRIKDIVHWYAPEEGVIRAKKQTGWGVMNLKGETIIDFTHISIGPCINGWLSYYDHGQWGWLKKEGGIAVQAQFDEVGVLDKNRWWGKLGKVCTLYDYKGQKIGQEAWEDIKKLPRYMF